MKQNTRTRCCISGTFCAAGLLSALWTPNVFAQASPTEMLKPPPDTRSTSYTGVETSEQWIAKSVDRAYKLKYTQSSQDQNEVLTGLRNMVDPKTRIFLVPSTSIIAVRAPEQEQVQIEKLLTALDQPHPRYRLTYTLTELDGTTKIGVQHFSMVVLSGQRSQMKQGSRLPIGVSSTVFNYIDVGLEFDATLQEVQGGGVLKNKVDQTSVAPDIHSPSESNPVLRHTQLEGTTSLALGKPQRIGALDVPSSTHHFDIEVVMEPAN